MTRVAVPDDYPRDYVEIRRDRDLDPGETVVGGRRADVYVAGERARSAKVREDDEGRYVGVYEGYAEAVREFFEREYGDDTVGTCQEVKTDGEVCGRELPCPYHSEDDEDGGGDE